VIRDRTGNSNSQPVLPTKTEQRFLPPAPCTTSNPTGTGATSTRPEEDERSPFFGEEHSEFEFTHAVYDHVIHPQWDNFGQQHAVHEGALRRLRRGYVIIELIGEWNDLLHNDIMLLKRNIMEHLMAKGSASSSSSARTC
jgi:hypothetical protein